MKLPLLVACFFLLASSVASGASDDRPIADAKLINELKVYCMEEAEDEGVGKKEMDAFLLGCINDELESEGYQPIKSLPK